MNEAQRTIEHISGVRGQHTPLDELIAELHPTTPDLILERRGSSGRWETRIHQVYRFADDSLADLSYSVPHGPDGNDVQPQCAGVEVYALMRQAVEYLTADQRHGVSDTASVERRQPVEHHVEWALGYWKDGQRFSIESIGSGDRAERLARGYHAKQSADAQLALTNWDRVTLEARDVYLAPWHTIDTPTTGTTDDQPSTTSAPQTTGQK